MKLLHEEIGYSVLGVLGKTEVKKARKDFVLLLKSNTFETPLVTQINAYRKSCVANAKLSEYFIEAIRNNVGAYRGVIRDSFDGSKVTYELTLYIKRIKLVRRYVSLDKDKLISLCTELNVPVSMHGVKLNKKDLLEKVGA